MIEAKKRTSEDFKHIVATSLKVGEKYGEYPEEQYIDQKSAEGLKGSFSP